MTDQHELNDELSSHEPAHPVEAVEPVTHSELSIPLAEPAEASQEPSEESLPDPEPVYEVLMHNEAVLRPRPFTFRELNTGAVVTLH